MRRLVLLLAAVALVAACGSDDGGDSAGTTTTAAEETTTTEAETTTTTEEQSTDVAVTIDPAGGAGTVEVSGTATVPDGALVSWEVTHEGFVDPAVCPVPEGGGPDPCFADGTAEVTDGAFTYTADGLQPGTYEVWTAFQTILDGEQPAEVLELYGEAGENITGDVTGDENLYRVETTATVEVA